MEKGERRIEGGSGILLLLVVGQTFFCISQPEYNDVFGADMDVIDID